MKTKIALFLSLLLAAAPGAFAKGKKAKEEKLPGIGEQPADFFYTGKHYDTDLGNYVFLARNYDPKLGRWTTPDPSGFPDGANNYLYVNNRVATCLDPDGRLQLDMVGKTDNFVEYRKATIGDVEWHASVYNVLTNDSKTTVQVHVANTPPTFDSAGKPIDVSYNCVSYSLGNSNGWINASYMESILSGDGYVEIKDNLKNAKYVVYGNFDHIATITSSSNDIDKIQVAGKLGRTPEIFSSDVWSQFDSKKVRFFE